MTMIAIHNQDDQITDDNRPMLQAILQRITHYNRLASADIWIGTRRPVGKSDAGWLEMIYRVDFTDGGKITIGCIQRQPGEPFEFHS